MAVKVAGIPAQTGLKEEVMVTLTGRRGFTVIVMELDVAGFPDMQVRSAVRMH